jgi:hypothetical protein
MWAKQFKDIPKDSPLKKHPLQEGKGVIGCEMKEINGWGQLLLSSQIQKNLPSQAAGSTPCPS